MKDEFTSCRGIVYVGLVVARMVGATEWYVDDSPHLAEGRLDDLCEQARLVKTVKGPTTHSQVGSGSDRRLPPWVTNTHYGVRGR